VVRKVLIAAVTGSLPDEYREEAINLLTDALRGPDDDVRALAVIALQEMGGAAPTVLPALMEALHDPNEIVRRRSARALGDLGMAALPALPHLISALQDSHNSVRMEAVAALSRLGPDAEPAIPAILGMLTEPELRLSIVAGCALKRMGRAVTPYLIGCLSDPNAILRERCALLLGRLQIEDDSVIESLLETCTDSEAEVRESARRALDHLQQLA
jgi:HEAT repeat protein